MLFYRCILPFLTFNLPRLLRRLTLLQGLLPPLAFFGFRALRFICRIGGNANIEVVAIIENNDETGFKACPGWKESNNTLVSAPLPSVYAQVVNPAEKVTIFLILLKLFFATLCPSRERWQLRVIKFFATKPIEAILRVPIYCSAEERATVLQVGLIALANAPCV